ncbi:MAG: YfcE family phosphodiesterase [Candidatus Micrarchaeia archaeon]
MIAVISDVHANLPALEAVLKRIEKLNVKRIFCAGDVVGYYPFPDECVEKIVEKSIECVMGNHDYAVLTGDTRWFNETAAYAIDFTRRIMGRKNFIAGMKQSFEIEIYGKLVGVFHGSPRNPLFEYVFPETRKERLSEMVGGYDALILGHTHIPMHVEAGKKIVVNPGSVGQPRDGDARASFITIDENWRVKNYRVGYKVEKTVEAVGRADLPPELGERLFFGF